MALWALFARLFTKRLALHTHDEISAGSETVTLLELRRLLKPIQSGKSREGVSSNYLFPVK